MSPFHHIAALSRAARASSLPRTPEPLADEHNQPPEAPKPRFRLKRRNASNFNAPTEHFLASVAAADVPIPSIEEPLIVEHDMLDAEDHPFGDLKAPGLSGQHDPGHIFSPPKTPVPNFAVAASPAPRRFPDWSMGSGMGSLESSPEYESSRPSTARSTQTSNSLFSSLSTASDDFNQCLSPEFETSDRFGGNFEEEGKMTDYDATIKAAAPVTKSRKAPWTKAMNQHLWSTYHLYLQDPHVTPFRVSKGGIPPPGVCTRVAREAKKSWKGSNALVKDKDMHNQFPAFTTGPSTTFMQWPHTCAATRAHLRELCKTSAVSAARSNEYLTHSPTPFGKTASRLRNRRMTPALSPPAFSSSDMALSLAMSTSESMQTHGPLAQLTMSAMDPACAQSKSEPVTDLPLMETQRARLGSPFTATYGPSSSTSLAASLNIGTESQRQTQTMGPQRVLKSPARVTRSRSNTQKRRDRQPLIEPRKVKRPSLGSDLWTAPATNEAANVDLAEFSSTALSHRDNLFVPRANIQELFEGSPVQSPRATNAPNFLSQRMSATLEAPQRLGSPFTFANSSLSMPNRFSSPPVMGNQASHRPFATVQLQQPQQQEEAEIDLSTPKSKGRLAGRLAYLDERLKELRRRRRSESPL
jgi:hypothetical protein